MFHTHTSNDAQVAKTELEFDITGPDSLESGIGQWIGRRSLWIVDLQVHVSEI